MKTGVVVSVANYNIETLGSYEIVSDGLCQINFIKEINLRSAFISTNDGL